MPKTELSLADVHHALRDQGVVLSPSKTVLLTRALNTVLLAEPSEKYDLNVQCVGCKRTYHLSVSKEGFQKWSQGTVIQEALPELSREERELLISQTCSPCFDKLFPPDEDE